VPTAPPDPLFGFDLPGFEYSIGGQTFVWDLDTFFDRINPFNGGEGLADAAGAAGDIAGAARDGAVQSVVAAIEPWVGRVAIIVLAFVLIAGALAMLAAPQMRQMVQEAVTP
jgi:hypothetical protein